MAAPDHEGLDGLGALEGADRLESARCLTTWVVLQDAVAAAPSMANAHRHGVPHGSGYAHCADRHQSQ